MKRFPLQWAWFTEYDVLHSVSIRFLHNNKMCHGVSNSKNGVLLFKLVYLFICLEQTMKQNHI